MDSPDQETRELPPSSWQRRSPVHTSSPSFEAAEHQGIPKPQHRSQKLGSSLDLNPGPPVSFSLKRSTKATAATAALLRTHAVCFMALMSGFRFQAIVSKV